MDFSFSTQEFNLPSVLPMLIGMVGGVYILLTNVCKQQFSRNLSVFLVLFTLALDFLALLGPVSAPSSFFNLIVTDPISLMAQKLIVVASFLLMCLVLSKERFAEFQTPEFYPLYLFMVVGFQLMVSSNHLLMIILGLESASLAMCVIMALNNKHGGLEAGLKYFTMGMLASVFFSMGTALLYLLTGSLDLSTMSFTQNFSPALLCTCAAIFLLGALGFKVSLVPFHTWMPDIYEGNNPVFAGFISIVPKIAGLVVAWRVFAFFLSTQIVFIHALFYFLIALTITIPNLMALLQRDAKRMMAYSSISHTGFALACVFGGWAETMFAYWLLFLITNIGAFALFWGVSTKEDALAHHYDYPFARFNGLIHAKPFLALLGAIFLFSLAGIPPFSMFWGKVMILQNLLSQHNIFLAIVMVVNSAIAACYYLRLCVAMFFATPSTPKHLNASYPVYAVLCGMAFLCIGSISVLQYYAL
ncbi:NADH-quinone oxidoreductase subunit NuoN [Helicobacter cynogastricus]|uniref:NADH-quinone oxidoreductase subunit NuoN n=1 Tax=Helicobacter cynogastricus TaxID=329937 RepID=UPI000CF10C3B|nr:NADH-quinone oxidoreductase subunit NuoN [Helicobacter cynogastricus]